MKFARHLPVLAVFALAITAGAYRALEQDGDAVPPPRPPAPVESPSASERGRDLRPPVSEAARKARPLTARHTALPERRGQTPADASRTAAAAGLVEFEVVEDGLAVAFGDVILGRIEEGSATRRGYHEFAALAFWDHPEIPYLIHPDLPEKARVEKAIEYFNQHTPVRFIPRAEQVDAIVFEPGPEHCYSALGRVGGLQPIRLSPKCQPQEILHEMMHALGFVHEQSRPDRDASVEVLWDAIEPKFRAQFSIVPDSLMEASRGTPFDFKSVMLYRPSAFAAQPGQLTLKPAPGKPAIDPVVQGLSDGDLQRLQRMYRL